MGTMDENAVASSTHLEGFNLTCLRSFLQSFAFAEAPNGHASANAKCYNTKALHYDSLNSECTLGQNPSCGTHVLLGTLLSNCVKLDKVLLTVVPGM